MKKFISPLEAAALVIIFLLMVVSAFAASGACSGHGGVDCSAGPDSDGSVICVDGWTDSSVSYDSMVKCQGSSGTDATEPEPEPETTVIPYMPYEIEPEEESAPEPEPELSISNTQESEEETELEPEPKPTPVVSGPFKDISFTYKYRDAVTYMKENSIVEGYSDGTYKPDNKINRAEFTKLLMAYKFPDDPMTARNCFTDVSDEWYAPYVCLAKAKGIIGGYPNGTFRPEQNITVPEALKIVLLADGASVPEVGGEWYEQYVEYADSLGLRPDEWADMGYSITRGEMAEVVWRLGG